MKHDVVALAKAAGFAATQGSYWTNLKGTDTNLEKVVKQVAEAELSQVATWLASAAPEVHGWFVREFLPPEPTPANGSSKAAG